MGFDISPGEYAASSALGGVVNFAPVHIGTAKTEDRAINAAALVAVAVVILLVLRRSK